MWLVATVLDSTVFAILTKGNHHHHTHTLPLPMCPNTHNVMRAITLLHCRFSTFSPPRPRRDNWQFQLSYQCWIILDTLSSWQSTKILQCPPGLTWKKEQAASGYSLIITRKKGSLMCHTCTNIKFKINLFYKWVSSKCHYKDTESTYFLFLLEIYILFKNKWITSFPPKRKKKIVEWTF